MKQRTALEILKNGHNVFLTGPAGSGKTFVLNAFIAHLKQQHISHAVTASTGIAATHIGGRTVHSWSGIGINEQLSAKEIGKMLKKPLLRQRFKKTNVLIIDEVSMIHAHQFDLVNTILQHARQNKQPFGGMQVVLSGDFFQLPPVQKNKEIPLRFIDQSQTWQELNMHVCYLSEQHRQSEDLLSKILCDIRRKCVTDETRDLLQKACDNERTDMREYTKLYTHNADVGAINHRELHKINASSFLYRMISDGNEKMVRALKNGCLAPEQLMLKKGALVMFVRNNFDQGYVNGTIGTVVDFDDKRFPIVETRNGEKICVSPETWVIEEDGEELACITQLPLQLAWAITIHKSQGMTLDAAEIDLSKCFEYGMGYVALSRVRTIDDIKLLGINDVALQIDPAVFEKDKVFQEISANIEKQFIDQKTNTSKYDTDRKIKDMRKNYPNAYKPWTDQDDRKLLRHVERGTPIEAIAKSFGRKEDAIKSRIKKMRSK